jgi:Na+/alanine symporter
VIPEGVTLLIPYNDAHTCFKDEVAAPSLESNDPRINQTYSTPSVYKKLTVAQGATLTVNAFKTMLPGNIGYWIAIGSVILFGFSCLISYFDYATQAAEYLFGEKSKIIVKILWVVAIVVGSQTTLGFVWDLADTFNGLMIIPNLIGLLILSNEVVKEKKAYFEANGIK